MGVNRFVLTHLLILCVIWTATSQKPIKSFDFNNESLVKAVHEVVDAYGMFVSYDPKTFQNTPDITIKLESVSITEALNKLLGATFEFKIFNEYVAITPYTEVPKQKKPAVVHDTVYLQKTKIMYDTIPLEVKQFVSIYDTITITKNEIVYDTVLIEQEPIVKNWQLKTYIAPQIWKRQGKTWQGFEVGLGYVYQWKSFQLEANLGYGQVNSQTHFTETETQVELNIDTIATYIVIENDQEIPTQILDSVYQTNDIVTETNYSNQLKALSFAFRLGKNFSITDTITFGVQTGGKLQWILSADEIIAPASNIEESSSLQYMLQNIQLELPMSYTLSSGLQGYYFSPFGEWGINPNYQNSSNEGERIVLGFKLGLIF